MCVRSPVRSTVGKKRSGSNLNLLAPIQDRRSTFLFNMKHIYLSITHPYRSDCSKQIYMVFHLLQLMYKYLWVLVWCSLLMNVVILVYFYFVLIVKCLEYLSLQQAYLHPLKNEEKNFLLFDFLLLHPIFCIVAPC